MNKIVDIREMRGYFQSLISFNVSGAILKWLPPESDDVGYTSLSKEIYINPDHIMFAGLSHKKKVAAVLGIIAHECMHLLVTPFKNEELFCDKKNLSVVENRLFHEFLNVLEDPNIEFQARDNLSGMMLKSLYYVVGYSYNTSPPINVDKDGNTITFSDLDPLTTDVETAQYFELLRALIQFGDGGFVKGDFVFDSAKEFYNKILPKVDEYVTSKDVNRVELAYNIFKELEPLWKPLAEDIEALKELSRELQQMGKDVNSEGDSNGENSNGNGSSSDNSSPSDNSSSNSSNNNDFSDRLNKRRQQAVEAAKEATNNSAKQSGNSDGSDTADETASGTGNSSEQSDSNSTANSASTEQNGDGEDENNAGSALGSENKSGAGNSSSEKTAASSATQSSDKGDENEISGHFDTENSIIDTSNSSESSVIKCNTQHTSEEGTNAVEVKRIDLSDILSDADIDILEKQASGNAEMASLDPNTALYEKVDKTVKDGKFKNRNLRIRNNVIKSSKSLKYSYDAVVAKNYNLINRVANSFKKIIRDDIKKRSYTQDGRLEVGRVIRPVKTAKVFSKSPTNKGKNDVCVSVLVDQSGSMSGMKCQLAKETAVILAEVCSKIKYPLGVMGYAETYYDSEHYHYLRFEKNPTAFQRYALMSIGADGCNFDGYAISFMTELMLKRKEQHKIMMVITDGRPNARNGTVNDAIQAVHTANKKGITVIGLGIDTSESVLKDIYGKHYIQVTDPTVLPVLLPQELKKIVKNW